MLCRLTLAVLLLTASAHAVVVRGRVTSPLGAPVPGTRVQLIRLNDGTRSVADALAGPDGSYEMRTNLAGRFLLLASPTVGAPQFVPQVGTPFYGGRTDLLTFNIALTASSINPQGTAQGTLLATPLPQLSVPVLQVAADHLLTPANVVPQLRPYPGVFLVERGQFLAPATLYLRGAPVARVILDGVSAEDLGGGFDFATLGSSGLSSISPTPALELLPAANPLHLVDAEAGTLSLHAPLATSLHPVLTYSVDAGNLSTLRNEAVLTAVHSRADALLSFARIDTDNDLPAAPAHLIDEAANLGYHISANTSLRLTLRNDISAAPLPSPFQEYDVAPATKLAQQNLYGGFTFDTRTAAQWHNLLRYGLVRKRAQALNFLTPATGHPVTILGANGSSAFGIATFQPLPAREDTVTNRDEATWQTDAPLSRFISAVLTVRYQNERAADLQPVATTRLERTHISVAAGFQGELRHRLFYTASGLIDHEPTTGFRGAPSLGLTYVPVLPGVRRFRGTSLHLTVAAGHREPSLAESVQATRMHAALPNPRSRTFEFSVDQTLLARRLTLRTTYFHNQFAHEAELLTPLTVANTLAYRTQGLESELHFRPKQRFLLDAGYTYLAALVEQSATTAAFNPNLPAVPIGALSALLGTRPFHRPPSTAFVTAEYTGTAVTASLKASLASRSDDSTNLLLNPALLLPNRNLSPGYASVDASITYNVSRNVMAYTQLNNLFDDRHIAPIGFLSTPFSVRAGLRFRLGRE